MFFKYNTALGPPYRVLLDTNFINFSIKNKLDIVNAGMDCLLAKVIPCVTDCVMAELEKLGPKYRVALKCVRMCVCVCVCVLRARDWAWCGAGPRAAPIHPSAARAPCRVAKDPRFERLPCAHAGTYADDCLVNRVTEVRLTATAWGGVKGERAAGRTSGGRRRPPQPCHPQCGCVH